MSEKTMRQNLVRRLRELDAQAIESPMRPGVPDINFCYGWIECKWAKDWPKREMTKVRFDHYTREQKVWHKRRKKRGGVVWVMVQIKKEWFLFDASIAADCLGELTRSEMHDKALYHWKNGLNEDVVGILATMKWVS